MLLTCDVLDLFIYLYYIFIPPFLPTLRAAYKIPPPPPPLYILTTLRYKVS